MGYDDWKARQPDLDGNQCAMCGEEARRGSRYCSTSCENEGEEIVCVHCEGTGRLVCTCGYLKSVHDKKGQGG